MSLRRFLEHLKARLGAAVSLRLRPGTRGHADARLATAAATVRRRQYGGALEAYKSDVLVEDVLGDRA